MHSRTIAQPAAPERPGTVPKVPCLDPACVGNVAPSGSGGSAPWLASLDPTSETDALRLVAALSEEYQTLAAHREQLLDEHRGEYVVIRGGDWHTFPTLAAASEWGHTHANGTPFFLVRAESHLVDACLAAWRRGGGGA